MRTKLPQKQRDLLRAEQKKRLKLREEINDDNRKTGFTNHPIVELRARLEQMLRSVGPPLFNHDECDSTEDGDRGDHVTKSYRFAQQENSPGSSENGNAELNGGRAGCF